MVSTVLSTRSLLRHHRRPLPATCLGTPARRPSCCPRRPCSRRRSAQRAVAARLQCLVQLVKQHIGQQWGQRSALGGAQVAINHHPAIHDPGVQVRPNPPDHCGLINASFEPVDQDVVVDPVKEPGQVHVHHHALARLHVRPRGLDRIARSPPGPNPCLPRQERTPSSHNRRIYAASPWSPALCGSMPTRPHAVALDFAHCDPLAAGLAPAGLRPCWTPKEKAPTLVA